MSLGLNDDKSTILVQLKAWCHQATSSYIDQCWPRSPMQFGVIKPQWVEILLFQPCEFLGVSCYLVGDGYFNEFHIWPTSDLVAFGLFLKTDVWVYFILGSCIYYNHIEVKRNVLFLEMAFSDGFPSMKFFNSANALVTYRILEISYGILI